mmetsp:Transcript_8183/g.24544  ORF Transcript_8183/g.24544 Transcript_8183/m.24544 type:complete len:445 (+) Transcript_8183:20-1354(+)
MCFVDLLHEHGLQDRRHHKTHDAHELDQNVQSRATRVLEWISDSVSHHGSLVALGVLPAESSSLDVLLAVIPRTTSIRHHDSHERAGDNAARENTHETLWAQQQAKDHWNGNGQDTWCNHLLQRSLGDDVNAGSVIGLDSVRSLDQAKPELSTDLLDDSASRLSDGEHGETAEDVGGQGTDQQTRHDHVGAARVHNISHKRGRAVTRDVLLERDQKGESSKNRRGDCESLSGGSSSVAKGIKCVCPVPHDWLQLSHLRDTTGVVHDGAICVSGKSDSERGKHSNCTNGHSVHAGKAQADDNEESHNHNWRHSGEHSNRESSDEHSRRPGLRGLGNPLDRRVRSRRAVLGGGPDDDSSDEAKDDDNVDRQRRFELHAGQDESDADDKQDGGRHVARPQGLEELLLVGSLSRVDEESSKDGAKNSSSADVKREGHPVQAEDFQPQA